ncbi:SusD/RagB family nutrient-binding outer membrane lipoprotein [Pontibacter ruber]|uniref:SusD/RagB family nutrient-binding outer membrane lipoprotein n=1 Tax=Pontibacter ruber TaxID=1343895 RepID=A0ABW5D4F0_9BACT|nr:SusD/RagB family nutrient-binding outer membrane lipoprotein [Pontibacter ruber]
MKRNKFLYIALLSTGLLFTSCESFFDVNDSPNDIKEARVSEILPAATVNIGFMGGSDMLRYSALIMQQFSGQGPANPSTTKEYERYNINNSDVNNLWNRIYSVVLADLEQVITKAGAEGSPHFTGVAKILKAYTYQVTVDAWGDVPFSEASKFQSNFYPKYDDDEAIYPALIKLLDEGIAEVNATASVMDPNAYSTIFPASNWETSRIKWVRFANTLKLRLYIHYSEKDPAFAAQGINGLINSGAEFMTSTSDNFEMMFLNQPQRQNPLTSIEGGQFKNQLFPNRTIVDMMNQKADPRRASYFVAYPINSSPATYKGQSIDSPPTTAVSRLHRFLKGTATPVDPGKVNADGSIKDDAIMYGGDAPTRLLTFAEYNFIRAEAALRFGAPGDAQAFFQEGIRASMKDAGIAAAEADAYIAANGTLTGSPEEQLEQIITEKYIANFGVMMEPWTDWRRTGYPDITPLTRPTAIYDELPRSLFYPVSEITSNPNAKQKETMLERVFWDVRQ